MNVMSRIQQLFANEKARIAYITVGDGGVERSYEAAMALIQGGVNMLELGMPFSDPVADGEIIQRAAARSLEQGTTLQEVLWLMREIRKTSDIPLILFSYFNPILSVMTTDFLKQAKLAGMDGLLLVDCPLEESELIRDECRRYGIDLIYIITSSTTPERIKKISDHATGFLYYACRKGTTGVRNSLPDDFVDRMKIIKSIVQLPVISGFGISNQEMARQVLQHADGVVVGSLFVKALEENIDAAALTMLARSIFP